MTTRVLICDDEPDTASIVAEDLGFEVLPSQANFVFARHPQRDARRSAHT